MKDILSCRSNLSSRGGSRIFSVFLNAAVYDAVYDKNNWDHVFVCVCVSCHAINEKGGFFLCRYFTSISPYYRTQSQRIATKEREKERKKSAIQLLRANGVKHHVRKPFGRSLPPYGGREPESSPLMYPPFPTANALIKHSRHVVGVATLMGADDQS